jgi:hypothetical protein
MKVIGLGVNNRIYTDRSRTLEFQRCPRARYLQYEHRGRGIVPARLNVPLTVGTWVHVGLGNLLTQSMQTPTLGEFNLEAGTMATSVTVDVDLAVKEALAGYDEQVSSRGLNLEANADLNYVYSEQRALIEAMIRAYALRQLPRLLEEYMVLEVEREDEFPLGIVASTGDQPFDYDPHTLHWMSRADGLLLHRRDGDLYVLSYKTAANWDARKESENNHDMQGLSEVVAVEKRLVRIWERMRVVRDYANRLGVPFDRFVGMHPALVDLLSRPEPPKVQGVKMEFLLKGERRRDKYTDRWLQYSPLVRAWRQRGITPDDDKYSWRYEWEEIDENTGLTRTRRLGKGWEPFYAWELEGGVKEWVAKLARNEVQPEAGDCLEGQFVLPIPYFRHADDMARWQRQVRWQETENARASIQIRQTIEKHGFAAAEELLDQAYPQHTRACDWPVRCAYQEICFGSPDVLEGALESGMFVWRQPHHEPELIQITAAAEAAAQARAAEAEAEAAKTEGEETPKAA